MSKLVWDNAGERNFESGVSHVVLYTLDESQAYKNGVVWNGVTGITHSPDGAEPNELWADNMKYATLMSAEKLGLTIEAYQYPPEFEACDGTADLVSGVSIGQQSRKTFGICYRTEVGNDLAAEAGYKLHLVYGCIASPSDRSYETINDSPDAITFSWEVTTTPVPVNGFKAVASVDIDSRKLGAEKLALVEAALYGTDSAEPYMPLPDALKTMLSA